MKTVRYCIALLAGMGAAPALAQDATGPVVTAAITGGTLGIGPEAGVRFSTLFGVRANATFLSISPSIDSGGIDYDGRLKLRSAGIMADVYPFGGGFRVSGGARVNGSKARVVATPTEPTKIGNTTFTPAQIGTLTGRAVTKDFAPALTLGYGGKMRAGFVFGVEAGALFQGTVRIRDFAATGAFANDPRFQAELARQRAELQDDVNDYKVYPIVQISLGYRF